MTNREFAEMLYDSILDEFEILKTRVKSETWQNNHARISTMDGIDLCIEKLKRRKSNSSRFPDYGKKEEQREY